MNNRLNSRLTTQLTERKTEQVMKEVFVVDGKLEIHPIQVPLKELLHPSAFFPATIGGRPKNVRRDGRDRFPSYPAGFETEQQAEEFRDSLKNREARKIRTMRRAIGILQCQHKDLIDEMRARYRNQFRHDAIYCSLPPEFSEADQWFRERFFSALRTLGLPYVNFENTMRAYEKEEKESTGKPNTKASYQLSWATYIVGENNPVQSAT